MFFAHSWIFVDGLSVIILGLLLMSRGWSSIAEGHGFSFMLIEFRRHSWIFIDASYIFIDVCLAFVDFAKVHGFSLMSTGFCE